MSTDTQTGKCETCGRLTDFEDHECSSEPDGVPVDQHLGKVVGGRYEILSRIGEGGTSIVYKGQAREDGGPIVVAVKILKPHAATDRLRLAQFEREAHSIRRLSHPNIIRLHHFEAPAGGDPFLVMDYLEGKPLSDVFIEDGVFSVERCIKIFSQVCAGLSHAHQAGVVHTDVKPSNIIVCQVEGVETVKIVDFGIAKLLNGDASSQLSSRAGEVLGSPLYMSPEQCAARTLDARSDIYSTACVIYEALTGEPPLVGKSPRDTMHMHVFNTPERIGKLRPALAQSALLETMMIKALAKHPDQRYQSMRELRLDLELELELNGTAPASWPGKPGQTEGQQPQAVPTGTATRSVSEDDDKQPDSLTPSSAVPVDHYLDRIRQIKSAYSSLFQSRRR
jgi:serine/threonine-protein kinase